MPVTDYIQYVQSKSINGLLTHNVGAGTSPNLPIDLAIASNLLNRLLVAGTIATTRTTTLPANGIYQAQDITDLVAIITAYQTHKQFSARDGIISVGGTTITALLADAGITDTNNVAHFIETQIRGTQSFSHTSNTTAVDATRLVEIFQPYCYGFNQGNVTANLPTLANAIRADANISDIRHFAYMLATAKVETGHTYRPVREHGQGGSRPYASAVSATLPNGTSHSHVYYGRGYVQLTWLANYIAMTRNLNVTMQSCPALAALTPPQRSGNVTFNGPAGAFQNVTPPLAVPVADTALAVCPDLTLDAAMAYRIMSYGMRNGSFTGRRLADYISGSTCDYVNARRIINALQAANEIAAIAETFELSLRLSILNPQGARQTLPARPARPNPPRPR